MTAITTIDVLNLVAARAQWCRENGESGSGERAARKAVREAARRVRLICGHCHCPSAVLGSNTKVISFHMSYWS